MAREWLTRRPKRPLTARQVASIIEPGRYHDGNGLFLRVTQTGAKSWVQRIVVHGRRRELGLGSADLVGLAEARQAALENRKIARADGDPLQARREAEEAPTFEAAARQVHAIFLPTWKNQKHAAQWLGTLESFVFPTLGHVKVGAVSSADVLAVLTPVWSERPETARRVRQRIGAVMKWAVAQGWRADNPAADIDRVLPRQSREQVHRKALPYDKVHACLQAVDASKAMLSTKLCFRFLVLTAARSGEAREAVWAEIDLEAKVWDVPARRMKMGVPHTVPLSDEAMRVLRQAAALRTPASDLVFPGARIGRPLSDMTLSKLVKELGFDADIHGFRTSLRTFCQEQTNFPWEVGEAMLAHQRGDAAARAYARSDLMEKRRALMQAWADYLERAA